MDDRLRCLICSYQGYDGKDLSRHLRNDHDLSFEEYAIRCKFGGSRPTCQVCGEETRFIHSKLDFKKYCKKHSSIACSLGGKRGGKNPCPFKGKTKETIPHLERLSRSMIGSLNPRYGIAHTNETRNKISQTKRLGKDDIKERIAARAHEFVLVSDLDSYRSRQKQYLVFRCVKCGDEQPKTLQAFERRSQCRTCFPIGRSIWECDVFSFIKNLKPDARSSDRTVISPLELDVYVPSCKLAVECHGLYWHSECAPDGVDKMAHLRKKKECEQLGVTLIQFFQDEWDLKNDICKSMLKHRLGMSIRSIPARKCEVVEISWKEHKAFIDKTHIAGAVPGSVYFALRHSNNVVASLSLRKPMQMKYSNSMEIARFSCDLDTAIPGGLTRLLSAARRWCQDRDYDKIVTYADRRFGDGKGYEAAGFRKIGDTGLDYAYTDLTLRYDRSKFRARSGRTEDQIAKESDVWKIYGCGSWIFEINV